VVNTRSRKEHIHVFLRPESLARAGEAAVKAQDELAALGLDGSLASQESPDIRAKENI
jgi:hypothetical protein